MLTWISTFCSLAMPGAYQVHRLGKQPAEVLLSAPQLSVKQRAKDTRTRKVITNLRPFPREMPECTPSCSSLSILPHPSPQPLNNEQPLPQGDH